MDVCKRQKDFWRNLLPIPPVCFASGPLKDKACLILEWSSEKHKRYIYSDLILPGSLSEDSQGMCQFTIVLLLTTRSGRISKILCVSISFVIILDFRDVFIGNIEPIPNSATWDFMGCLYHQSIGSNEMQRLEQEDRHRVRYSFIRASHGIQYQGSAALL